MARITVAEVQAWLSDGRITVASGDLIEQLETRVLGRLEAVLDTSGWADNTDTPDLVRQVIALLNAAAILRIKYSDQEDGIPYADKLEDMAEAMLMQMESGKIDLTVGDVGLTADEMDALSVAAGPAHFPGESERLADTFYDPNVVEESPHKQIFHMGQVF